MQRQGCVQAQIAGQSGMLTYWDNRRDMPMIASHRWTALFVLVILMPLPAFAGTPEGGYRQPPEPLLSVMRAPLNPSPRPDPTGRTLLLVQRTQYPPIARVAEPYLKLAGVRVEPRTHSRHDMSNGYGIRSCLEGFSLVDIASGKQTAVSLPAGACPALPVWSPDGRRFAFNNTAADHVELWVGDVATGQVRKIDGVQLNPVLGGEIQWLGGSSTLLLKTVPQDLGPAPRKAAVPPGPEVKETIQGKGESSTYEARDTLSSPQDEALFTYYATAQLLTVDAATGSQRKLGTPAVYSNVDGAPDGRHVLVERLKPPYSYVTTYARFAHDVAVLDLETGNERVLANLPVADRVPVQGVPTGPRAYAWRANQPATLVWAEALDGGDWKTSVPARDTLMTLAAPFTAKPRALARVQQRYAGLSWFAEGGQALLDEYDENRHWRRTTLVDADRPGAGERVLFDLSTDDLYADPGLPEMRVLANGQAVLREAQGALFLSGQGASPAGDRPFLDRYTLATGKSQRLFRSDAHVDEVFFGFAGDETSRLLTWHQSLTDPPNVYVRTLGEPLPAPAAGEAAFASTATPVTHFADPTPLVRQIKKRLVSYKRKDGVDLSFTLYTPPGYKEGTRVPAILYATRSTMPIPPKLARSAAPASAISLVSITTSCCYWPATPLSTMPLSLSWATPRPPTTPTCSNWSMTPPPRWTRPWSWAWSTVSASASPAIATAR